MKRWGAFALMISLAAASGVDARTKPGFGGRRYGGPPARSHRRGGLDIRFGFGSWFGGGFGAWGSYAPYWSTPYSGWGGYPGYLAYPRFAYAPVFSDFGYGLGFPFLSYSPTQAYLPFWNNAAGVSRYSLPWTNNSGGANVVELPPRVVVIDNPGGPRLTDGSASLERAGERFYLEPSAAAPARERPSTLKDSLRQSLRIESADKDHYLVRWTGDPSELAALELSALDADRKVVMRRLIKEAPFRGLLHTGGKTTMVTVSFDLKDGPTVTLEYPLERFQALAND